MQKIELEALFNKFADPEFSDQQTFLLNCSNDNPELTFSEDAMERFRTMISTFIGARVVAFMDQNTKVPKSLSVTIEVKVSETLNCTN